MRPNSCAIGPVFGPLKSPVVTSDPVGVRRRRRYKPPERPSERGRIREENVIE